MIKLLRDQGIKVEVRDHLSEDGKYGSAPFGSIMVLVEKADYEKALRILEENGYLSLDRLRKNSDTYLLERLLQLTDKIPVLNRLMPLQKLRWSIGVLVLVVAGIAIFAYAKGRNVEALNRLTYYRWEVVGMDLDGEALNVTEGIEPSDIIIGSYDFSKNYLNFDQDEYFSLGSFRGETIRGNFEARGRRIWVNNTSKLAGFPEGKYTLRFYKDSLLLSSERLRIVCKR